MTKYLLDTNLWIALTKGEQDLVNRVYTLRQEKRVCMALFTVGELFFGAINSQRWMLNVERMTDLVNHFEIILPDEDELGFTYGLVKSNLREQGITLTENDLWIASTAIHYRLTLVTRDRDFNRIKGFQLNIEAW